MDDEAVAGADVPPPLCGSTPPVSVSIPSILSASPNETGSSPVVSTDLPILSTIPSTSLFSASCPSTVTGSAPASD